MYIFFFWEINLFLYLYFWKIIGIHHCISCKAYSMMLCCTYIVKWSRQIQLISTFSYKYNGKKKNWKILPVIRTLRIYFPNNHAIYHTAVLAVVVTCYVTSPGLTHLITGSLYILANFLQILSPIPNPPFLIITSQISFLCVWVCVVLVVVPAAVFLAFFSGVGVCLILGST